MQPSVQLMSVSPGIRAMAIGAFWFSIMGLLVKLSGQRLGSMEIVLARGVITLGLSWWSLRSLGESPWGNNRRLLLVRGTLGSTSLMCYFFSLVHLPLGEATLIQNVNPVFATILAAYLLKEHLRAPEILCLFASLAGVLFIAHPPFLFGGEAAAANPWHIGIALLGAAASGSAYTLVRKMRGTEHPLVVVFYLPLISVPTSLPFALAEWRWPNAWEWALLVGVGVTTQLAQVSMTRGLQLERTARATTTGYLQVAFAVAWGALLLGEIPDVWTLTGAVTIIGSTLVLTWWNTAVLGPDTA
ncbi:MAG TPA: DMT family transporter [Gemmatimonadaceae bacterium]|nr:DMT family transporter [Gemmatimonadaceae bacterium]